MSVPSSLPLDGGSDVYQEGGGRVHGLGREGTQQGAVCHHECPRSRRPNPQRGAPTLLANGDGGIGEGSEQAGRCSELPRCNLRSGRPTLPVRREGRRDGMTFADLYAALDSAVEGENAHTPIIVRVWEPGGVDRESMDVNPYSWHVELVSENDGLGNKVYRIVLDVEGV